MWAGLGFLPIDHEPLAHLKKGDLMGGFKEESIETSDTYEMQINQIHSEISYLKDQVDLSIDRVKYYKDQPTLEQLEYISKSLGQINKTLR